MDGRGGVTAAGRADESEDAPEPYGPACPASWPDGVNEREGAAEPVGVDRRGGVAAAGRAGEPEGAPAPYGLGGVGPNSWSDGAVEAGGGSESGGAGVPGGIGGVAGGVGGRGGMEARRASVLMLPPFPRARAIGPGTELVRAVSQLFLRAAGTALSGRPSRARIPAVADRHPGRDRPRQGRPSLRARHSTGCPCAAGNQSAGPRHLPGTSPYPAVILSGRLRS